MLRTVYGMDACMMTNMIESELLGLGITPDYRGYRYLCMAIEKAMQNEEYLYCITTKLYADIARTMGTTPVNVERSIRTVITVLWNDANTKQLYQLMGRNYETPPGNAKFIGVMSRRLHFKYGAVEL
ncbi:MAG: sporulation initiation factor Spo0A C-terminal domain-containing protein [Clostridia bacterium]